MELFPPPSRIPVRRLLSCSLAAVALCGGVALVEAELGPADLGPADPVALRASLPTCPTSRQPRARYARCFIDRSRGGVDNTYRGSGAKEYFDGRLGNDNIVAGPGDDKIIGGAGVDVISGGTGNDVIDVRDPAGDSSRDTVSCGPGRRDVVYRNSGDVISRDCEFRR